MSPSANLNLKPFWQLVKCLHSDVFCVIVVLLTRHSWPPRGTNVQPSTVIAYTLGLKNSLFSVILSLPFPLSVTLCCCVFAGGRAGGSEWRAWSQWVWDEGWADPVIGGTGSLAQSKRPGKAWGSDPLLGNQVLLTSRSQASRLSRQCRWKKLVRYKHRFLLENSYNPSNIDIPKAISFEQEVEFTVCKAAHLPRKFPHGKCSKNRFLEILKWKPQLVPHSFLSTVPSRQPRRPASLRLAVPGCLESVSEPRVSPHL